MANNILTASVTQVPFGNTEIEGLLLEDGSFAVSIQQAALLFQVRQDNAQRDFKYLLGKDARFVKIRVKNAQSKKSENCLTLIDFERLIFELTLKGNKHSVEFSRMLVGLSLTQLFSDAFGIKFEKEDRQAFLKNRMATKESFWFLSDEIKAYIDANGSSNPQYHYINAFKVMSVGLFGKTPSQIKEELGLTKGELNRDHFGVESLRRIDIIQTLAQVNIKNGIKPYSAVIAAISTFNFSTITYTK